MADDQDFFDCPICFELMQDPVTTTCGHSYCMKCINAFWDINDNGGYSCPQCRQRVTERPLLKRNTLLAALLEEKRKNNSQRAAAEAEDTYAESGDVACDACTERKRKASTICLVCLASYCETHLKPHFEVPPLKKHKLTKASHWILERICRRHDKLMEHYCRTDQQFICLQCVEEEHKDHDTVTVTAEKHKMQRQLDWTKQEIADRLLYLEGKKVELRQAADSVRDAAWQGYGDFQRRCEEHIRFVQIKCLEMREKAEDAEKSGADQTNGHLGELQQEEFELRKREDNLDQLSLKEDQLIQFLKGFVALGDLPAFTDSHKKLDTLTEFVREQRDNVKNIFENAKNDIFSHFEKNELVKLELDPNTVAACLCLSDTNDEISWGCHDQAHPDHPDRFTHHYQALCKNALSGSHYWEVEWDGGFVDLAVSYKCIQRKGSGKYSCFGHNKFSWKLTCSSSGCVFWHNSLHKGQIPPALCRKVGVHLDYKAGTLAFYSVSDRFTLLHKIQTTFRKPLYPGFSVDLGSTLKICHL
ncbi:E3 ubiquitin/ISG15 ligase TRIM25-like [Labrus bergylta]|uniref:E3 ubiquitin/ISG15 ligase TRIM25-like n=1 Tax=Labrus bergylta TaxID=56723 RepID=UPI00331433B1